MLQGRGGGGDSGRRRRRRRRKRKGRRRRGRILWCTCLILTDLRFIAVSLQEHGSAFMVGISRTGDSALLYLQCEHNVGGRLQRVSLI
jgi:hypothetical protein